MPQYDPKDNQAILNGIRHLSKESTKRTRKCSSAVWFDLDLALKMVKPQFEKFFMEQALSMMEAAWRTVQDIKREESKPSVAGGRSKSKSPHKR